MNLWRTVPAVAIALLTIPAVTHLTSAQSNPSTDGPQPEMSTPPVEPMGVPDAEMGPGSDYGPRRGFWIDQLNLTDAQLTEIRTIYTDARDRTGDLRQQLWDAQVEMRDLMASEASADQLRQQHDKLQSLHQQMGEERFETLLAVRSVLTPEQRAQLADLGGPHGHHGGRGGGPRSF